MTTSVLAPAPTPDQPSLRPQVYSAIAALIATGLPAPSSLTVGRDGYVVMWFDPTRSEDVDRWAAHWEAPTAVGRAYEQPFGHLTRTYFAFATTAEGWRVLLNVTVDSTRLGAG